MNKLYGSKISKSVNSNNRLMFTAALTRWPGKAISGFCVMAIFARACAAKIRPVSVPSLASRINDCNSTSYDFIFQADGQGTSLHNTAAKALIFLTH